MDDVLFRTTALQGVRTRIWRWIDERGLTPRISYSLDPPLQLGRNCLRLAYEGPGVSRPETARQYVLGARVPRDWERAYHGTWWYALWSILETGTILESKDEEAGHEFTMPGVYCTPRPQTARQYARPQMVFGDSMYHRVMLEVRVDKARLKDKKKTGGVQWVCRGKDIVIRAVWFWLNDPPAKGEERFEDWRPGLEARPTLDRLQDGLGLDDGLGLKSRRKTAKMLPMGGVFVPGRP
jgi:hypothetical protein